MLVNKRIKEQRKKSCYTQRELSEKVNVSPQVISNWERGYTEPSAEDINKLAEVLHTSSDYLLGRTDDPNFYLKKLNSLNTNLDISEQLYLFHSKIKNSDNLTFNDEPVTEEEIYILLEVLEFCIRLIKRKNNYRNEQN